MEPNELELAEAELELAEAVEVPQGSPEIPDLLKRPDEPRSASVVRSPGKTLSDISQSSKSRPFQGDLPRDVVERGFNAFTQGASMGLVPRAIDAYNSVADPGSPSALGQYQKDAQDFSGAAMLGRLANPTNLLDPSSITGNALLGAGQSYVENPNPVEAAQSGLAAGGVSGALKGAGSLLSGAMSRIQAKMTPAALKFLNDLAESVAFQGSNSDADAVQALREAPSQMGLGSKLDDIKYSLINELSPTMLDSPQAIGADLANLNKQAGANYGRAVDPIRSRTVPASQMQSEIGAVRDVLRTDPEIPSGPDAEGIIADLQNRFVTPRAQPVEVPYSTPGDVTEQFSPRPGLLDPNSNAPIDMEGGRFIQGEPVTDFQRVEPELPYSVVDEMKKAAQNMAYDKSDFRGMGVTDTSKAVTTATGALDNVLRGEMTPAQIRAFDKANAEVGRRQGLTQAMSPGLQSRIGSSPGSGTMSEGLGRMIATPAREAISRSRVGVMNLTRNVANRGLEKMRAGGLKNVPSNEMAPFQIAEVERKLQAIKDMPADQAIPYAYAESLVNPLFRSVWMEAQSDDDQ